MDKVSRTIREMLAAKAEGKSLQKRQWIVRRRRPGGNSMWFTITVEKGDKLNG